MGVKGMISINGEVIGEAEATITVERNPPYWCPDCNQAVKAKIAGKEPDFEVVCEKCGSSKISGFEEIKKKEEFNPSKR